MNSSEKQENNQKQEKQEQQEKNKEKRIHEMCNLIMRQTNMTYDEANKKLLEKNYNYLQVIKEYIGIQNNMKLDNDKKSINQKIYCEIRTFMDQTSEKYEARKKQAEKIEVINRLKQIKEKNVKEKNVKE